MANSSITKTKSNYNKNYYQAAKNGLLGFGKCRVEWCKSYAISRKGYCNKHLTQIKIHGSVRKTYNDPSNIEKTEEGWLVHLCDRDMKLIAKAIVDTEDYDKIVGERWHLCRGYAVTGSNGDYLHRRIFNKIADGYQVDHIDMDRLNNRRSNLRLVTIMQNSYNQKIAKNNTSGFKGVFWNKRINKYVSQIQYNKTHLIIGSFETKIEACNAYNEKAKELHGQFASINKF